MSNSWPEQGLPAFHGDESSDEPGYRGRLEAPRPQTCQVPGWYPMRANWTCHRPPRFGAPAEYKYRADITVQATPNGHQAYHQVSPARECHQPADRNCLEQGTEPGLDLPVVLDPGKTATCAFQDASGWNVEYA